MTPLMQLAFDWAVRSFGMEHVSNRPVRALRAAEEVVELCQAYRIPKEKLHDLVDIVYSRMIGDPDQELGGVVMTAAILCAREGYDMEHYLLTELRRVLAKPPEHFADRNAQKIALGLDVHA